MAARGSACAGTRKSTKSPPAQGGKERARAEPLSGHPRSPSAGLGGQAAARPGRTCCGAGGGGGAGVRGSPLSLRHLRALPQGEMPELLFFLSLLPLSLPLWTRPWERFPQAPGAPPAARPGPGPCPGRQEPARCRQRAWGGGAGTVTTRRRARRASRQETRPFSSRLLSPTGSVKDRTAGAGRGRLGSRASSEHRGLLRGHSQPSMSVPAAVRAGAVLSPPPARIFTLLKRNQTLQLGWGAPK